MNQNQNPFFIRIEGSVPPAKDGTVLVYANIGLTAIEFLRKQPGLRSAVLEILFDAPEHIDRVYVV